MRLVILIMFLSTIAFGQRTLMLEEMTTIKPKKFYEGQHITVKLEGDRYWHNVLIQENVEATQSLVTDFGLVALDEITNVRIQRNGAVYLSGALYSFGGSTLLFGSLAQLRKENRPNMKNVAIFSASTIASGWLINKLFRYKNYKIGRKNRLKIIDLTLRGVRP